MGLEEKLKQSTGENTSELTDLKTKVFETEGQNELIAQRIDQLAKSIEENNNKINENMRDVLQKSNENEKKLNEKIKELKSDQEGLASSFENSLNGHFDQLTKVVGESFEKRTDEVAKNVSHSMQEIENQFKQQSEKQQKNIDTWERIKFIFVNVLFAAAAVVLVRALFYGFWEGFNIKGLYEWGSQWAWLKYTMIGLYGFVSLVVTIAVIALIVDNIKYFRERTDE